MTRKTVAYWSVTGVFCLVLSFSGVSHLFHLDMMVESMTAMGYPVFFMTIIGFAKLLGVAALLAPGRPLLKEWAYAGFTFNLLGAVASHLFAGDSVGEASRPAGVLLFGAASYWLRPDSRRLPSFRGVSAGDDAGARSVSPNSPPSPDGGIEGAPS